MKYRPELDGLRGISVLMTVALHAGAEMVSGGFVGVDVFFVLSGYLIARLMIEDLYAQKFSLTGFYARRARRILPAFFLVMLCCVPFAWAWMMPVDLTEFGHALIAGPAFVANILFWRESGYFSTAAELKPLITIWSLAVEEQFYLLFPAAMLLVWHRFRLRRRGLLALTCGIGLVSLGLAEWGWRFEPDANFYLAPSRVWELLAGVFCAVWTMDETSARPSHPINDGLALAGLAAILAAAFVIDQDTPTRALMLPVGGTMLILLFATPGSVAVRLLSSQPLRALGVVSYGAYLWHQPLFAFARLRSLGHVSPWAMAGLCVLTFVLAALSYRYVEQPIRQRQGPAFLRKPLRVMAALALTGAVIMAIGVVLHVERGFPQRSNGQITAGEIAQRIVPNRGLGSDCTPALWQTPACRTAPEPEVLLWGDSYAMQLVPGLLQSAPGLGLQQATVPGCAPLVGISHLDQNQNPAKANRCIRLNADVMQQLQRPSSIKLVILSASFVGILRGKLVMPGAAAGASFDAAARQSLLIAGIEEVVARIEATGRRVVLVSPAPVNAYNTGNCLARAQWYGSAPEACDFALQDVANRDVFDMIDRLSPKVAVLRLDPLICPDGHCAAVQAGRFIWRDAAHLSIEGSTYLGAKDQWMARIRAAAALR